MNLDSQSLRQQVKELVDELKSSGYLYNRKGTDETYLAYSKKFNLVYSSSKTLFDLITSTVNGKVFDETRRIEKALELIESIQCKTDTQESASEKFGKVLANDYIPENLK